MTCDEVMDALYACAGNESPPVLTQLRIQLHLLHCSRCAAEIETLERARSIMRGGFFPPSPSPELEERIMRSIAREEPEALPEAEFRENKAGVSFRSWVVTGLVILVSLSTSFLGMDFGTVADHWGSSFLLPIGITVGVMVSAYGAIFIGSHLEELSDRFNLR